MNKKILLSAILTVVLLVGSACKNPFLADVKLTPTNGGDTTPPAEVTSLSAVAGHEKVTLSWTPPADSDFAKVEITHNQSGGTATKTVNKGTNSYTWTGLTNGTAYTFTVKTVDSTGNKSTGTTKTATPVATYSLSVARITGQDSGYGSVEITTGAATGNASGATVKVTATAGSNYTFVKWVASDSINGTQASAGNPYTFTISANTTLYAVFDGDGTNTPKNISTKAELVAIGSNLSGKYALFADITGGDALTAPISASAFTGTLDGNGHSIVLAIGSGAAYNAEYGGLFAQLGAGATVKNLALTGVVNVNNSSNSNNDAYAGAVAGKAAGGTIRVENIKSEVAVRGDGGSGFGSSYAGGIVGYVDNAGGTITNCYSSGNVESNSSLPKAGGIAGYVYAGTVSYCYASGTISASRDTAGGIVGFASRSYTSISHCVALNASITGNTAGRVVGDFSSSPTLSGLYGKSGMLVKGAPVTSGNDNDENGANFTDWATAWPSAAWNGTTSGWKGTAASYGSNTTPGSTPKLWWE
jgi:hypothetical protein